jgi:hypothetical protein
MEETKALLRQLHTDNASLGEDIGALQKSNTRRDKLLAALIVVVLVVGLLIWRIVAYAACTTTRGQALTGPGNDRVSQLLGAFTASVTVRHLTPAQRAADLAVLRKARDGRYPLIPPEATLKAAGDAAIAGDAEAVRALDTNARYLKLAAKHPVCSLWSVG